MEEVRKVQQDGEGVPAFGNEFIRADGTNWTQWWWQDYLRDQQYGWAKEAEQNAKGQPWINRYIEKAQALEAVFNGPITTKVERKAEPKVTHKPKPVMETVTESEVGYADAINRYLEENA